jgi:hypothetical protein
MTRHDSPQQRALGPRPPGHLSIETTPTRHVACFGTGFRASDAQPSEANQRSAACIRIGRARSGEDSVTQSGVVPPACTHKCRSPMTFRSSGLDEITISRQALAVNWSQGRAFAMNGRAASSRGKTTVKLLSAPSASRRERGTANLLDADGRNDRRRKTPGNR